jgi:hypothetical protein
MPELEPRDYLYALKLLDFDVDSQLIAVRGLLHRNRKADEEQAKEIKDIEEHTRHLKGLSAEWAADQWVDELHHSTYQSVAHSISAVGLLAPLIETIFHQCFLGIGNEFYPRSHPIKQHGRSTAAHAVRWDCHFLITAKRPRKNLVGGILQLAEAVELLTRLPSELAPTLSALFAYRNNMFHHGFEWPVEERQRFAKRVADGHWPADWFLLATTDNEPWIFCLTDKFIEHCLTTIHQTLDATGLFVRDVLVPIRDAHSD